MADNFLERQREAYEKKKELWLRRKKRTSAHPVKKTNVSAKPNKDNT